jgi:glucose/arabinose dehydrogenase
MALDPQFSENHYVYAAFTFRDSSGALHNKVVSPKDDPAANKGTLDKTPIDNIGGGTNHDGGRLKFGPDNKLYYTRDLKLNCSLKTSHH